MENNRQEQEMFSVAEMMTDLSKHQNASTRNHFCSVNAIPLGTCKKA